MLDLPQQYQDAICCIAQDCFHSPVEILAYGSRVNGDNHEGSDLDVVIRTPDGTRLPWGEMARFKEALYESNIPILVQAFDWGGLPESFNRSILKKHELLFSTVR